MADNKPSLGKTLELLLDIAVLGAEKTYEKIKATAPAYVKSLAITAVLWIITTCGFIILKAETGYPVFGYFAAVFAVIFTAVLGFLWAPLGIIIGMARGETANPIKGGEHYLKSFGTLYIMVIMASICIVNTDFSNNPDGVLTLFLAAAAVVLSSALGARLFSAKFYAVVSATVLILTLLSFGLPNMFNRLSEGIKGFDEQFREPIARPDFYYEEDGVKYFAYDKDIIPVQLKANQWHKIYVPSGLFLYFNIPGNFIDTKYIRDDRIFISRWWKNGERSISLDNKELQSANPNVLLKSAGEYLEIRSDTDGHTEIFPIKAEGIEEY